MSKESKQEWGVRGENQKKISGRRRKIKTGATLLLSEMQDTLMVGAE